MKLIINERQLSCIVNSNIKNRELDEEDTPSSPEPTITTPSTTTTGTSTSSGTQGYPETGKWASGLTRGHANPIGITKWESGMTRGHANPLK